MTGRAWSIAKQPAARSRRVARPILLFPVCCLLFSFSGCIHPHGTVMVDIDPRGWDTPASVVFENSDTLAVRDISVVVRYRDDRAPQSISIDIQTLTPDSLTLNERVELPPDRPSIPYRAGVVLARKGAYTFTFTPEFNMRGISAIGVEIR